MKQASILLEFENKFYHAIRIQKLFITLLFSNHVTKAVNFRTEFPCKIFLHKYGTYVIHYLHALTSFLNPDILKLYETDPSFRKFSQICYDSFSR